MNILGITVKGMRQRKFSTLLTMASVAVGVALVVSIHVLKQASLNGFALAQTGVDLVVGPKGDPLSIVLQGVYQKGEPQAKLPMSFYEELRKHPAVDYVIPVSLGDSYRGNRVVGTSEEIFSKYEYIAGERLRFAAGGPFAGEFEGVVGSAVAKEQKLKIGDSIQYTCGLTEAVAQEQEHAHKLKVVGILAPTRTPSDRLIYVGYQAYVHLHQRGEDEDADHDEHEHATPAASASQPVVAIGEGKHDPRGVSLLLVKAKSNLGAIQLHCRINDGQVATAALPSREIQNLFAIIGGVTLALHAISVLVVVVAAIGIMVAIYNSMSERTRAIAVMRALGASKRTIEDIILTESALICVVGGLAGLALGYAIVFLAAPFVARYTNTNIVLQWSDLVSRQANSLQVPLVILYALGMLCLALLGMLVGLLPARRAYKVDVAGNLTGAR